MNTICFGTGGKAFNRFCANTNYKNLHLYTTIEECMSNYSFDELKSLRVILLSGLDECYADFHKLCSIGVDPYRISFYENLEWRKGCTFIKKYIWFGRTYYRACVYRNGEHLNTDYSGDIGHDFSRIMDKCEKTISLWRNQKATMCDGCTILKEGLWPRNTEFSSLSIYGGFKSEHCNFKCFYCDATDNLLLAKERDSITIVDAIKEFITVVGHTNFTVSLSAGEITVSPYKEEVFKLLRRLNMKTSVFSNGYIFDENIYDMLCSKQASLDISIDAGTRDTFYKIKRVDGFERVVKNISKYYKSGGRIELKYIIIEGVNDNSNDISNFLSLCQSYATSVRISTNKFNYKENLKTETLGLIHNMINHLRQLKLPVSISYSQFNDEDCKLLLSYMNIQ